ncbi:MAG: universal stress protein [Solirubrobacteraceae bacterium]
MASRWCATTSASATVASLKARAHDAVERGVAGLRGQVEVAVRAGIGKAAEELVKCSADMDLVVLGPRGYGPSRTMLLGSVSSQVVPEARSAVMILAARLKNAGAA